MNSQLLSLSPEQRELAESVVRAATELERRLLLSMLVASLQKPPAPPEPKLRLVTETP